MRVTDQSDVWSSGGSIIDTLAGPQSNQDEWKKNITKQSGVNISSLIAYVVPIEEDYYSIIEDSPSFELSYWEIVAFIYGLYYALFLLLEAQLVFSKDYYELQSINRTSRYHYLENYRRIQNRNRSPSGELAIFKILCGTNR